MVNECRDCRAGRPHCHGTLIRHSTQHWECTDTDCDHPELFTHSLTIDCEALGCECGEQGRQRVAV